MSKPKSAKMPDPKELMALDAQLNRPDIHNPFGSSQWAQDAEGNWTQNNKSYGLNSLTGEN